MEDQDRILTGPRANDGSLHFLSDVRHFKEQHASIPEKTSALCVNEPLAMRLATRSRNVSRSVEMSSVVGVFGVSMFVGLIDYQIVLLSATNPMLLPLSFRVTIRESVFFPTVRSLI